MKWLKFLPVALDGIRLARAAWDDADGDPDVARLVVRRLATEMDANQARRDLEAFARFGEE